MLIHKLVGYPDVIISADVVILIIISVGIGIGITGFVCPVEIVLADSEGVYKNYRVDNAVVIGVKLAKIHYGCKICESLVKNKLIAYILGIAVCRSCLILVIGAGVPWTEPTVNNGYIKVF